MENLESFKNSFFFQTKPGTGKHFVVDGFWLQAVRFTCDRNFQEKNKLKKKTRFHEICRASDFEPGPGPGPVHSLIKMPWCVRIQNTDTNFPLKRLVSVKHSVGCFTFVFEIIQVMVFHICACSCETLFSSCPLDATCVAAFKETLSSFDLLKRLIFISS